MLEDGSKIDNYTLTEAPFNNKIDWEYASTGGYYVLIYSYNASKLVLIIDLDKSFPSYNEYRLTHSDGV